MLDNVYLVQKCLEDVRIMVQQSRMDERARDAVPRKGFEEEDPTMYGDSLKPNFGMAEVKKRRGVSTVSSTSSPGLAPIRQSFSPSPPLFLSLSASLMQKN